MRKSTVIGLVLLLLCCIAFAWAQHKIRLGREGLRVEEKILMLSDRPQATKIAALGFDGALADMLWIRSIQYFGGNFSTLSRPEKRQGLENLFNTLFVLDPQFTDAYEFAGFVANESMKDPDLAINYLLQGASENPEHWKLPFDAGFITFFQMQDYEAAKNLFLHASFGPSFFGVQVVELQGLAEGDMMPEFLVDEDLGSEVKLIPEQALLVLDMGEEVTIGRINIEQRTHLEGESFVLAHTRDLSEPFTVVEGVDTTGFHELNPPITTRYLRFSDFKTTADDGLFAISEIDLRGPRNPNTPSYVDRMAIEMERNSGRFSAAWNQYLRYYDEALSKGDEISAQLALDKLESIYDTMAHEILEEATEIYQEEHGSLPSPQMTELIVKPSGEEKSYIERIIDRRWDEDKSFLNEVAVVIFKVMPNSPGIDLSQILTNFDASQPNLLVTFTDDKGQEDWYIATRKQLLDRQEIQTQQLQSLVNKYKEEAGQFPEQLEDLKRFDWFIGYESLLQDPLKGEFQVNPQTGEVQAVNPQL